MDNLKETFVGRLTALAQIRETRTLAKAMPICREILPNSHMMERIMQEVKKLPIRSRDDI